jgi:hypothetical protein
MSKIVSYIFLLILKFPLTKNRAQRQRQHQILAIITNYNIRDKIPSYPLAYFLQRVHKLNTIKRAAINGKLVLTYPSEPFSI